MRKENEWKVLIVILAVTALVFLGFYKAFIADDNVDKIRRGDVLLICMMTDGERVIEKDKVVDFTDGVYHFINGNASNCREVKNHE